MDLIHKTFPDYTNNKGGKSSWYQWFLTERFHINLLKVPQNAYLPRVQSLSCSVLFGIQICVEVKIKPEYPKTNIQVPNFSINGYCFYQRVQWFFSQNLLHMRNINSKQLFLKTTIKAFVMKQMDKLKCRIVKEPIFIVAKIKMSVSISQKGQNKSTWIPGW